jgi:selenocysteine-specific elongation factor
MKKHTIIGTAGHIDHGKTAVIQALTGIDADRLKEEKARGITIDIGFAYWKEDVTILDVPGHERFIRNMVAGVNTIDFWLLIIAADDGIMPQTIEHLDILNFLNIRDGIVIINKCDLVEDEWLGLVGEEVKELLNKYQLRDIPIINVSAVTKFNIDQLQQIIEKKIIEQEKSESTQPFRLLVDRSFTIKGFGTVVTGTVISGNLKKGDELEIHPIGFTKRVRGLQAHGHETDVVVAGDRAAVNLQGISKMEVVRGDVLAELNTMTKIDEFIGTFRTVSKLPVKIGNRSTVRIYAGTAERIGQLIWYDSKKYLEEETSYHARIKLETPITVARNDAFLIRLHSPVITLAGGRILEINPPKIHHQQREWQKYFDIMSTQNYVEIIETIIYKGNFEPVPLVFLYQKLFDDKNQIISHLDDLIKKKKIRIIPIKGINHYIHEESFSQLVEKTKESITYFHKRNPHIAGLNQQELRSETGLSWIRLELFESVIKKLLNSRTIKLEDNLYSLADFSIQVSKNIEEVKKEIVNLIGEARFSPATLGEISQLIEMPSNEIRSIVNLLVKDQKLVHIDQEFYLHYSSWTALLNFLKEYFSERAEMPVSELKEFIQTTRKFAIPLFEYLDSEGYTVRSGDVRKKGHKL